jgi:hypothetical protein
MYDFTDAYKALATLIAGLDTLSAGVPNKVEEGSMTVPEYDETADLPYAIIETASPMSIASVAPQRERAEVLVKLWYVRATAVGSVPADELRSDGNKIAQALRHQNLGGLVSRIFIAEIDWSSGESNIFNVAAQLEEWPVMAVTVTIALSKEG